MKKASITTGRIEKGAPRGLLISLVFHLGAFFLAGVFVVFTVINNPEPEFVLPLPAERPEMNLQNPQVKVEKNSSSRMVAEGKTHEMPGNQLPDLMGEAD